ncbi:hypothetical protein [Cellulomonas sp. GbtcB1]|uniref:hypothetical protein n=1 Tax=Cellulomonas sp. GbtcB1 TaxID=2824746 RepID=UPI001C3077C6|nr:hypothetical protein [Cellulomonas sp. GbtcB1]
MTSTTATTTTPATTTPTTTTPTTDPADGWVDPRTQIEVGVLLANGRLVGRRFASREEAEAFARPEDGEQVVEYNLVCECVV